MADGDAYEFNSASIALERNQQGVILFSFFFALLVAAEVPAVADLKKDEGAVLAVKGFDFRGRVGRHSSGVDDVGCHPRSDCYQAV